MFKLIIILFTFLGNVYCYDYEWKPTTRSGMWIDQFSGGTRGPGYQFEQTYTRSCGLGCVQTAKASDFAVFTQENLHYDTDRSYNNNLYYDTDRNYNNGIHCDPDRTFC